MKNFFNKLQNIYDNFQEKYIQHIDESCAGCDYCCSSKFTYPPVSYIEYDYIEKEKGVEKTDLLKEFMIRRELERCPFYSAEKGCGIYEIRPLCCRLFGIFASDPSLPENCIYKNIVQKTDERILFRRETDLKDFMILKLEYELEIKKNKNDKIRIFTDLTEEYIARNEIKEAKKILNEIKKLDKQNYSYYFYKGIVCKKEERIKEAIKNLEKAKKLGAEKEYPYIYEYLGFIYYEEGELKKARKTLTKAMKTIPDSPQVYTVMALISLKEALLYCKETLKLEPHNPVAKHLMVKHSLDD